MLLIIKPLPNGSVVNCYIDVIRVNCIRHLLLDAIGFHRILILNYVVRPPQISLILFGAVSACLRSLNSRLNSGWSNALSSSLKGGLSSALSRGLSSGLRGSLGSCLGGKSPGTLEL